MEHNVTFTWDDEADVWIATSKDIPGLVLESGSFDALTERVRFAIPELLALNSSQLWDDIEEVPPDEWDLKMLEDIENDPDCHEFVSQEDLLRKLNLTL